MPILDIQKRVVEVGRIRAGDQAATERGGRRPRKLVNWRLTSKDRRRLDAAAELWGGSVADWPEREGEFQLYTKTNELPIMLIPGQLPTTWYELWSAGGVQRRCDGVTELLTDQPCLCGENRGGSDYCSPHTRLAVILPDLPGIGSWLVQSTGWNAAAELAGVAGLLQQGMLSGILLPARLRLEQRQEVKKGQTRKYAVPVIDIDVSMKELLGTGALGLPAGPQEVAGGEDAARTLPPGRVSVADGLKAVAPPAADTPQRANAAEPIGDAIVDAPTSGPEVPDEADAGDADQSDAAPVPQAAASAATAAGGGSPPTGAAAADAPSGTDGESGQGGASGSYTGARATKPLTKAQKDKLNVLYGQLRRVPVDNDGNPTGNPRVSIGGLYAWAARERNVDVDTMIDSLNESIAHRNSQLESAEDVPETLARDEDGRLHFGPLRDSLTRAEASSMIDGLEGLAK